MEPQKKNVTKGDLLRLLDCEIARAESELTRPGYTSWGLLASAAWLLWTLLAQVELSRSNVFSVVELFFGLLVLRKGLKAGWNVWREVTKEIRAGRNRFVSLGSIASNNPRFLYESLVTTGTLCFFWFWRPQYPVLNLAIFTALGFPEMVAPITGLSKKFRKVSIGSESKGVRRPILFVPICGYLLLNIVAVLLAVKAIPPEDIVSSVRVAALLFALYYVTGSLIDRPEELPLVQTLNLFRRDLLLDNIGPLECAEQIDIALFGLKFSDLFQSEVADVIGDFRLASSQIERMLALVNKIQSQLTILRQLVAENREAEALEEGRSIGKLQSEIATRVPEITALLDVADKKLKAIYSEATLISKASGASELETGELRQKLTDEFEQVKSRALELVAAAEKADELIAALEREIKSRGSGQ